MEVLVLGSDGLLGSQVIETLTSTKVQFIATQRKRQLSSALQYSFEKDDLSQIFLNHPGIKYVINCIGYVKQKINKFTKNHQFY